MVESPCNYFIQSVDQGDFVVPHVPSTRISCRSFSVCGPTVWNTLHRFREAQTLGNSWSMAKGLAIRVCVRQEANGLTYLLIHKLM